MHSEKRKYILNIIEKLQDGIATQAEVKYLTDFYLRHQEFKSWPIDLESKHIIKDKIFQNILSIINVNSNGEVKVIPFYNRNFFKYAVAVCLFLLISITFIVNNNQPETLTPILVNHSIKIGTNRAILTLENGTLIPLESHKSYKVGNVSSDGEALVYTPNDERSSTETIYNTLTIPRGAQFFVQLSDGTKIWLNSESQLKYPVNFVEGKPRHVELVHGEAYFDVSPDKNHKGSKFVVKSGLQEIEVVGTEFNVSAYSDDAFIYTTLVEGKVAITLDEIKKDLKPNQQAVVNTKTQNIQIESIEVYDNISWKDGVFSFNQMPLKNIMKVLARWYDVDVNFENKELESVEFNGILKKDQHLRDILEIIKTTNNLDFEIKNKTITLK